MKKSFKFFAISALAFALFSCQSNSSKPAEAQQQEEEVDYLSVPKGARVFFENLQDGDEVTSPFTVLMGVEGMSVDPAGLLVQHSGHHHIIINGGSLPLGEVIPMDAQNLHYGDGSMQAELELEPGEYTLTMQFGNGHHQSYGEAMSAQVFVIVK